MKKIIILYTLLLCPVLLFAQNLIEQANQAYTENRYEEAISLYEEVISKSGKSPIIYYNLGNSYYRLNKIAPAILNYERALLLDPANEDIRFNLEIAKLKTVDKIESVDKFFLVGWYDGIQDSFSTNQWSYIAIFSFITLIVCLFLFFFTRRAGFKKIGFFLGSIMLVVCIFANIFAHRQEKELSDKNTAIIFSATTTIKSSPAASGTDSFILHEGTKVSITDKVGEWSEIQTADGYKGWILSEEIEII